MKSDQKQKIIAKFQHKKGDTGSAVVQIAILSERIKEITGHLKNHPKDFHTRRGLLGLVGKRRRLLNYLKLNKKEAYDEITEKLALKK